MSKIQTSLRLEEETFNEAKEILKSLGMNFTEAVNIFTSMVVQERITFFSQNSKQKDFRSDARDREERNRKDEF